ncbi:hypothetical protein [Desulfovibrio oxyclinae]|uniref:hypothetical protein n=1 Tax=Desulfovibrio oxyclinae TaxID=63560 RepID=UPI00058AFA98|nr:hypothetical protein [Desulfovibrio oxyclinae]
MKTLLLSTALLFIFSASAFAGGPCYTKKGYVFAASEELFDKAMRMISQKDRAAFMKLAKTGLVGITRDGVKVFREDVTWDGMCEIRPAGETGTVWTNIEAVDCK